MNTKKVEQIIKIFENSSLIEMDLEIDDIRVHMKKAGELLYAAPPVSDTNAIDTSEEGSTNKQGEAIKSPLVGTFYAAPSEDAEPFVKTGSSVSKGDTLCIVEAMKSMNEIKAKRDGKVTHIVKENAEMVQYDDVLMYIE